MAKFADKWFPCDDCSFSNRTRIDGLGEPDLHASEVDVLRRSCAVAWSHQRMSDFSIIKTKLALVIRIFSLSDRQRFSFARDILVNKASRRASLVFFFDFLVLLDDLLDPYLLLADSEHISFLDHVLLGRQALDYNPRLLFGLGILADDVVVSEFVDLLLFI